jgi:hypothetical protein
VAEGLHTGAGSTPVPDPTVLTTAALAQAIAALREILEARIDGQEARMDGQKAVFEARLNGMDKAITLLQDIADKLPLQIDGKVRNLERFHEEKFESVQTQFRERDVRSERESKDNKVAVDAALQAAKEAVTEQNKSNAVAQSKSEASFTKQIDQISTFITSAVKGLDDKINDLKERFSTGQGVIQEKKDHVVVQQGSNANMIAIAAAVAGVIGAIVAKFF